MASVKFNAIIADARGKVGDIVYSRNQYGAYVRDYVIPANPASTLQGLYRGWYATAIDRWQSISDTQRKLWHSYALFVHSRNVFGDNRRLSAFNCFIKISMQYRVLGLPQPSVPDGFDKPSLILPVSFNINTALLQMVISWSPAATSNNRLIIETTAPLSAGVNFVSSEYVHTQRFLSGSSINIWSMYSTIHGVVPVAGDKVFIRLFTGNARSALYSTRRSMSAIAV